MYEGDTYDLYIEYGLGCEKLGGGAIAGIVIVVLVGIAFMYALRRFMIKRKLKQKELMEQKERDEEL